MKFLSVLLPVVVFLNTAGAANVPVAMTNFRFTPTNVTINVGDTVTWTCQEGFHDTVSGSRGMPNGIWNSSAQLRRLMQPGDTFSFTFTTAGTFPYYCSPHWQLDMVGTIRVIAANSPPNVSITSPMNGANFAAPADITVEANASDSDGTVTQVQFFMNGTPIGIDSSAPYRATVNNLGPGNYIFSATATDNGGATASASVSVMVSDEEPPICEYSLSKTGTSFEAGGGADSVGIITATNCPWTVGNTNTWIVVTSGPSGRGPATVTFTVLSNATRTARRGVLVIATNSFTVTQAGAAFVAQNDFNHDGQTDFLWQHADGRLKLWLMNGLTRVETVVLRNGRPAPRGWSVVGTHDFNGDHNQDILFQHVTGPLSIWYMNGTSFARAELISGPALGRAWRVVGLGDLNQDGQADFLLRHRDGYLLVWLMRGNKFVRQLLIFNGEPIPPMWRVVGVAAVNSDDHADVLWQSPNSSMVVWFMNGLEPATGPLLSHLPRLNARIVGLNDLNQDDALDFIWRHPGGQLSVWLMDGTNRLDSVAIKETEPLAWKFVAPRD